MIRRENSACPYQLWCRCALFFATFLSIPLVSAAQENAFSRLADSIAYRIEACGNFSDDSGHAPLWLISNRHGLGGVGSFNGHLRQGIFRDIKRDSLRRWRVGYGADIAEAHGYTSNFIVQQLYAELGYGIAVWSVGAKERPAELKNAELSSGGQTFGVNARPIPEVRFDIPQYVSISGKRRIVSVKGHIGYGVLTDGNWEASFTRGNYRYVKHALYHEKAGYIKIGNEALFPLTLEGGLEMGSTFAGHFYRPGGFNTSLSGGLRDFFDIAFGLSSDKGESSGDYKNTKGNTLGSWLLRLSYHGNGWGVRAYYDHFFEDHSGLFYKYGDYDGLYGVEVKLPRNPVADCLLYEHIYTKYQSGPLYHDPSALISDKICGKDDYYNHILYAGWQHWGFAIGNPLFLSPIYNGDHALTFKSNRFAAHHFGISGSPTSELRYRLVYTYAQQLGTYIAPYSERRYQHSMLCELRYSPHCLLGMEGLELEGAFALDRGSHTGDNTGFRLAISKRGFFSL